MLEWRSGVKTIACSVTISKRNEEMTTKQKKQSVNTCRNLSSEQLNAYHKFGLSCYLFSRQYRDVRNKNLHKSNPCCFQAQAALLLSVVIPSCQGTVFSLADNSKTFFKKWNLTKWRKFLYSDPLWYSQYHRNTFNLYKSTNNCNCAWASLNEFLKEVIMTTA